MKYIKIHIILSFIFLNLTIHAQIEQKQTSAPIVEGGNPMANPEVMPEYPGGMNALYNFVTTNIKLPAVITEKGIYGTCYVRFTVDIDGSIKDIKILKGVKDCPECDEETKRIISIMPKWKPGKVNEKISPTFFTLPFKFKAQ